MRVRKKLPKRLKEDQIKKLAKTFAQFHQACYSVKNTLPPSSKTMRIDIEHLLRILQTSLGKHDHRMQLDLIEEQCHKFLENSDKLNATELETIPVFVDWNIGNFSVTQNMVLHSRWDYDWFRVSSRMTDFYFFSRIVSAVGDQTVFSYDIDRFMEDRFLIFLKAYHEEYPLTEKEILFLPECYRFFLLNYVVKYGRYFFHDVFSNRLQMEACKVHLPAIEEKFDADPMLKTLFG